MSKANRQVGSSLDDFLQEEGILEEGPCSGHQRGRCLSGTKGNGNRTNQQSRDGASDEDQPRGFGSVSGPGNASLTLQTLSKAARAIGHDLRIELV
jgi:hypothetical protein